LESIEERRNFAKKILGEGPLRQTHFAGIINTLGSDTFSYSWNSSLETTCDPGITRKYLEQLLEYSLQAAEKDWLRQKLGLPPEPVDADPPAADPPAADPPAHAPVCFIIREEGPSTKINAKSMNITLVRIDPRARNDRLEIPLKISLPTPEEIACIDKYFASRPTLRGMEAHDSEQLMTQIGSRLFQSIFSDIQASNELARCRENHRSMEFVVEGSPAVHAIPWELLHYVFGHANQSMPLISYYPIFRQLTAPSEFHSRNVPQNRLGILWVTARHPKEDFKKDAVLAEVRESLPTDQVDLKVIESGSFLEMIRALEEHTLTPKYHVLHLDMHGLVCSPAELRSQYGQSDLWAMDYRQAGLGNLPNPGHDNYKEETPFVLFNQGDKVMPVSAAELSARLAVAGVPLVVLNACQSATVPAANPSLIAHLVQAGGFPAVGFQQPTTLACTHLFFKTFYRTLLANPKGRDVQEAVHRGRRDLHDNLMRGALGIIDWWLPVLYTMPGRRTL
jgi:hypothetical protein